MAADKRSYLLTYLLPSSLSETEVKAHAESIEALVKKHKGSVTNLEQWGKRHLAYKMRHAGKWLTEAYYLHFTIEIDPAHITQLEKDIHLQAQIMRHLIVINDEKGEVEAVVEKERAKPTE